MLRSLRALVILIALPGACATVGSSAIVSCPPLAEYTPEQQVIAADELQAMPRDSMIARMIGDYGVLRQQVRACKA